jgi:hypothetical protein
MNAGAQIAAQAVTDAQTRCAGAARAEIAGAASTVLQKTLPSLKPMEHPRVRSNQPQMSVSLLM